MGDPSAEHRSVETGVETAAKKPGGKEAMPDKDLAARLVQAASGQLSSVAKAAETKQDLEPPAVKDQLRLILDLGKGMHDVALSDQKPAVWNAYIRCVNDFRSAYANLPPINDTSMIFKRRIGDAMERRDAGALLRVFAEERSERAKPPIWQRIPGLNFIFGAGAGAKELAKGVGELGKQGFNAVAGSPEEKAHARHVLASVGKSLMDLNQIVATVTRKEEYAQSIRDNGETTGFVLGKSAFDIASAILSGGAGGVAGKVGGHIGREAGHVAGHIAAEAGHVASHAAQHKEPS